MGEGLTIISYQTDSGKNPFDEWLTGLDRSMAVKVDKRLDMLAAHGHFGVHSVLKAADDIIEIKFTIGPGYRIYCHKDGEALLLLLCAGDKKSYRKDIKKAAEYWSDYQLRK